MSDRTSCELSRATAGAGEVSNSRLAMTSGLQNVTYVERLAARHKTMFCNTWALS